MGVKIVFKDTKGYETTINKELIILDELNNEIRVYENERLIQVIPSLNELEILLFEDSPTQQTEMDILRDYVLDVEFRLIMIELGI